MIGQLQCNDSTEHAVQEKEDKLKLTYLNKKIGFNKV